MTYSCDRYWLLTWTTYGTWLPGDPRGFVSNVWNGSGPEVRHNVPQTPCDADMPGLQRSARESLKSDPVYLSKADARLLIGQFRDTAAHRQWTLLAAAVMSNHCHLVVGVPGDPEPDTLLRDFKSYGSRVLNEADGKASSVRRWTRSGSRRKLPTEEALLAAVSYVQNQHRPLAVWSEERADDSQLGESSA